MQQISSIGILLICAVLTSSGFGQVIITMDCPVDFTSQRTPDNMSSTAVVTASVPKGCKPPFVTYGNRYNFTGTTSSVIISMGCSLSYSFYVYSNDSSCSTQIFPSCSELEAMTANTPSQPQKEYVYVDVPQYAGIFIALGCGILLTIVGVFVGYSQGRKKALIGTKGQEFSIPATEMTLNR